VELLHAVVDQVAIAIEQAELYAKTRAAAFAAETQAKQLTEALQNLQQTQSQLIQTEKMSSLGQMVAGIAHEINNPVNFITGNLSHAANYVHDLIDLINRYQQCYPQPTPEIQEIIEDIDLEFLIEDLPKILSSMKMGADRIREIVLSLRQFSRLDDSQMKPFDIHEGIDSTLLILQNRLKPRGKHPGITIVKEYGEIPPVMCYHGQINQVLMNILSNAIDALEGWNVAQIQQSLSEAEHPDKETQCSGNDALIHSIPPLPTIWVRTDVQDGNQVVLRIRDNGPGITPSILSHLFEPFFTTKPVGKGTGLGLSISYQIIVEKHGGNLKCISEPGQGAEFWIQIPISPGVR
jgi:two-component system, NtrC family, sensor kinase